MKQNLWQYTKKKDRVCSGRRECFLKSPFSRTELNCADVLPFVFQKAMSERLTWQQRCNSTVWTLDLQNKLNDVTLNREIPGPEDRCTNRTDGDWQLKECRGWSKAYRDLSFLGFAYNLLQQKSSWGKEGISQKLSEVSREDGFLDKVVNKGIVEDYLL